MPELLLATPEMATEYARWFVNRRAYTRQSDRPHPESGRHYYYRPRAGAGGERPLEPDDIRRHLAGEITLGLYAVNPRTQRVKWLAIDADYKRSLDIRQKKLDAKDPRIADSLTDLAGLYVAMGDYKAAEPLLNHALELRQKALGPDHPDVAETQAQLASLKKAQGNTAEAEALYKRALQIRETKLGLAHPSVAASASDLGDLYFSKGDLQRAEGSYQRALDLRKKAFGNEHPAVAQSQFKMATLLRARGELAKADQLLRTTLQVREKQLGGEHPEVAETLVLLAAVQIGTGKLNDALPLLNRALLINESILRNIGQSSNEGRVDAFLRTLRVSEEITYSLLVEKGVPEAALTLAASTALLRKGRSVDEAADTSRALYQGLGPEEKQKLAALRAVRTQRADLSLSGAGVYPPEVYQKLLKQLQETEEKQQAELLKSSAALRAKMQSYPPGQVLEQLQKAMPPGTPLVEILAFSQYDFRPTAQ